MSVRNSAIKLAVFAVFGILSAVLVVNTLRVPVEGPTVAYKALFTDAQGVTAGSDVTIAGVRVGRVASVDIVDGDAGSATALVNFEVQRDQTLPAGTTVAIRYGDLLGIRYLDLAAGSSGEEAPSRRATRFRSTGRRPHSISRVSSTDSSRCSTRSTRSRSTNSPPKSSPCSTAGRRAWKRCCAGSRTSPAPSRITIS